MNYREEIENLGISPSQYEEILKIISEKKEGKNDLDWSDIKAEYNIPIATDVLRKANGTIFGGSFVYGYLNENKENESSITYDSQRESLTAIRQEVEKQRVKMRDERNELNRVLREQARKESFLEQIVGAINQHVKADLYREFDRGYVSIPYDTEMVVTLFDLHTGLDIDNAVNRFNGDVLKSRLLQYLDRILDIQITHNTKRCNLILSELISGLIHNQLRIEANQNIIEQFLYAMDLIADFTEELSYNFDEVKVYCAIGNHSRVIANKKDSLTGENFDLLAIPFLKAKLQNFNNVHCYENDFDDTITTFEILGHKCAAVHGDRDSMGGVTDSLIRMLGYKPEIVWMGHKHHNAMLTDSDTKVIQSGCMSGSDSYCMSKRLRNKPEQTVSIVNRDGLECVYDIRF